MTVYVDDFLLMGSGPVLDKLTKVIEDKWNITNNPVLKWGSGLSVEYLSVRITALPDGFVHGPVRVLP